MSKQLDNNRDYEKIKTKLEKKNGGFCNYCHKWMFYTSIYKLNHLSTCAWCFPTAIKTKNYFQVLEGGNNNDKK